MKRSAAEIMSESKCAPKRTRVAVPEYTTRDVSVVLSELEEAEEELECIGAEQVWDDYDLVGYKLGDADPEEFQEANAKYEALVKERNNFLDLIKHGFMKWVEGSEREYADATNVSEYYYYAYCEGNEIQKKGWWQFSAPLSDEHQAHFDDYLQQYFYYGKPIYQDPCTEEYTDGDLSFEDGSVALYTADEMRKKSMDILLHGSKDDIQGRIELYGDDAGEDSRALLGLTGKSFVPSPLVTSKCRLANLIKKYHH